MSSGQAICRSGNALCPATALSRLFNIPLSRPPARPRLQPSFLLLPSRHSISFYTTTSCLQDDASADKPPSTELDAHAKDIDTSSLTATLEAHRRSNRESIIELSPSDSTDPDHFRPNIVYQKLTRTWPNRQPAHRYRNQYSVRRPLHGLDGDATEELEKEHKKPANKKRDNDRERLSPWRVAVKERSIPPSDYVGQYVEPVVDEGVPDNALPWLANVRMEGTRGMERLNAEMKAYLAYILPTAAEQAARQAVIDETLKVFEGQSNGYNMEIFGSQSSGLAFANSDLDLRLYKPKDDERKEKNMPPNFHTRKKLARVLEYAFGLYEADENYMLCVLRHARYPLLHMQHRASGLDIQIVCSNDTSFSRQKIKRYLEEHPALMAVYAVVRHMLELRGLTDVFRGGLGSYSIFMMVAASFKLNPQPESCGPAEHLIAFLDFYSRFDSISQWITVEPPQVLEKLPSKPVYSLKEKQLFKAGEFIGKVNPKQPFLLSLLDPADPTNDLGRKCFAWKHIQATMRTLAEELSLRLETNDGSALLTPIVGRNVGVLEMRRTKLQEFGLSQAKDGTQ